LRCFAGMDSDALVEGAAVTAAHVESLIATIRVAEANAAAGADYALAGRLKAARDRVAQLKEKIELKANEEKAAVSRGDYEAAAAAKTEGKTAEGDLQAAIVAKEFGDILQATSVPAHGSIQPVPAYPTVVAYPADAAASNNLMHHSLLPPGRSNEVSVPAGAPSGGRYIMEKYCGPVTWCIFCFCCCCAVCCPCDDREVYVAPDGRKFTRLGAPVEDCC